MFTLSLLTLKYVKHTSTSGPLYCCFPFLKCFLLRYLHNLHIYIYLLLGVTDAEDILTQSKITLVSSGVPNTFLYDIHSYDIHLKY